MRSILISTLVLLFTSFLLYAQETGSITGKVISKDSKQPLPGATVTLLETNFGTSTDVEGKFILTGIPEQIYRLQVNYVGYTGWIETDVRVVRKKTTMVKEIELAPTTIQSEEVVVTMGAFKEDKLLPVSAFTYSREEIIRTPGAGSDVFRAIETLPGVGGSTGEFSAFAVRGGNPKENIILIDNVPFGRTSHFDEDRQDAVEQGGRYSIFAPGLVEEAQFQAGGFPARYGGKNASILNLSLKEGNPQTPTTNAYLDLLGGEVNYNGPSYLHEKTSLLVSARYIDFLPVFRLMGELIDGHPRFADFILKTTTDVSPQHKISVLGIYSPEKADRDIADLYTVKDLRETSLEHNDVKSTLVGINWRWLTSSSDYLQSTFYATRADVEQRSGRMYLDPINGHVPTSSEVYHRDCIYQQHDDDVQIGVKSMFTHQWSGESSTSVGIDVQRKRFEYSLTQNGTDTSYIFDANDYRPNVSQYFLIRDPEETNSHYNSTTYLYAAFVEHSHSFGPLTVNPGVRYERDEITKKSTVSPRLSGTYHLNDRTSLNAAGGIYYQQPNMKIIAVSSSISSLQSELAYHSILGITQYIGDDLKFSTEVYYKVFDRLIVRQDRTSPVASNRGNGWARGIDLCLVKRFTGTLYGQINYSYSESKRNDHDGTGEYDADFNQPHLFNILSGWQISSAWSISTKWKYAAGRPRDAYILHSNVLNNLNRMRYSIEIIQHNADRLPATHALNVRVDYRKQYTSFALIGYIDILNLYNRLNVYEYDFDERLGTFHPHGNSLIPTFGIRVEF